MHTCLASSLVACWCVTENHEALLLESLTSAHACSRGLTRHVHNLHRRVLRVLCKLPARRAGQAFSEMRAHCSQDWPQRIIRLGWHTSRVQGAVHEALGSRLQIWIAATIADHACAVVVLETSSSSSSSSTSSSSSSSSSRSSIVLSVIFMAVCSALALRIGKINSIVLKYGIGV
jgi:hypothetical protein